MIGLLPPRGLAALAFFVVWPGLLTSVRGTAAASESLLLQRSPATFSRAHLDREQQSWWKDDLEAELQEAKNDIIEKEATSIAGLQSEVSELKQLIITMQQSLEAKLDSCCNCKDPPQPEATPEPFPTPEPPTMSPPGPPGPPGPSTSTNNSGTDPGLCAAFGDPHFTTFDGAHTILLRDMPLWLVKSEDVWIQGLSKETTGNFMGFAVGGPFMSGHTLILYNDSLASGGSEPGKLVALFDGKPILTDMDAEGKADFEEPFVLWAARRAEWEPSVHDQAVLEMDQAINWSVGTWESRFQDKPRGGLFLFRLPQDIELTATGVDYMSLVIKMSRQAKGQTGYCGNFNGDAADDFEPAPEGPAPPQTIAAWNKPIGDGLEPVDNEQNLFKLNNVTEPPAAAQAALQIQETPPCEGDRLREAESACNRIPNAAMRQACVADVCLTGNLAVAASVEEAEILQERVNARGIAAFVGHGRCVDTEGRGFRSLATRGIRSAEECRSLVRRLSKVNGVLGAQLRVEGTCEVLVHWTTDAASTVAGVVPPGGGWASVADAAAAAESSAEVSAASYVAGVAEDLSWSCWRLN